MLFYTIFFFFIITSNQIRRPRSEWILDFQGMMILAADQIWWTAEVENVFNKISMGKKQAMKEVLLHLAEFLPFFLRTCFVDVNNCIDH